jgi:hypothetical protein
MKLLRRIDRNLSISLLIAFLSFVPGIDWGLPEATSPETVEPWAIDTVAPIMPLNEAYYKFTRSGNEWLVYPLFHFIVLDFVYAPYIALQYFSGNLEKPSDTFPYGIEDPIAFCRTLTFLANAVSLLMALGIVIIVYQITAELFSARAGFWASLMTALLAPLSYYAKTSNLDVPYIFWSCLAFWQYIRIIKRQHIRHYIAFAIFAALAIATKDQAYGFFALIPLVILYALARKICGRKTVGLRELGSALFSKPAFGAVCAGAGVFAVANNLIFGGWPAFIDHLAFHRSLLNQRLEVTDIYTVAKQFSLLQESAGLLIEAFGYGSFVLCLGGILQAFIKRQWLAASTLLFAVSYYTLCLAVVGLVFIRYLLAPAIMLTPFAGAFIVALFERKPAIRTVAMLAVAGCFLWQAAITANLTLTLLKDSRYQASSWIHTHIPRGTTIESWVPLKYSPHLSKNYRISVQGVDREGMPIKEELTEESLQERNPQHILLQQGLGVSGDPETWQDPEAKKYWQALISGKSGYRVVETFETPHFIPFRQITGTRPTVILLERSTGIESSALNQVTKGKTDR